MTMLPPVCIITDTPSPEHVPEWSNAVYIDFPVPERFIYSDFLKYKFGELKYLLLAGNYVFVDRLPTKIRKSMEKIGVPFATWSPDLMPYDLLTLVEDYGRITVIGDVHGNFNSFRKAVKWAGQRSFVIFLGDLVSYGRRNIECIDLMFELVTNNRGAFVIGNHDAKFARYFDGCSMKMSSGNMTFVNEFNSLCNHEKYDVKMKFKLLCRVGHDSIMFDNVHFSHCDPIDEPGIISFVGHTSTHSMRPVIVKGKNGSKIVMLDGGCSKGGWLLSCDLVKKEDGWVPINYNVW